MARIPMITDAITTAQIAEGAITTAQIDDHDAGLTAFLEQQAKMPVVYHHPDGVIGALVLWGGLFALGVSIVLCVSLIIMEVVQCLTN